MSWGGGKYEPEAIALLQALEATGVVLLVAGGRRGEGFSVCTSSLPVLARLPAALRRTATAVEVDLGAQGGPVVVHRGARVPEPVNVVLRLTPTQAAALKRFAEKTDYDRAGSVLYAHKPKLQRDDQTHEILVALTQLEKALGDAGVNSWPWVETGAV